jgi:hypothetical protein
VRETLNLNQTKLDCETWLEYKKRQDEPKAMKALSTNDHAAKAASAEVDEAWHAYENSFAANDPHAPVRIFDKPKMSEAKAASVFDKYFASIKPKLA